MGAEYMGSATVPPPSQTTSLSSLSDKIEVTVTK